MIKNKFIDSTCLFSQKNLLDAFSSQKQDVISFYDMSFDYAWPKQIMSAFSINMSALYPHLAPVNFEDHILHKSKVCQILLTEQELVWKSIEELKKSGLVNIIQFDDPFEGYVKNKPLVTDESLFELWSSLKMKVLRTPHAIQKALNIVPLDIDVVAHAIATNNIYKSQNPKIADGTMAKIMGVQQVLIGQYDIKSIDYVDPDEIEEFIENKERFFSKTKYAIHKGYQKIFFTTIDTLIDMIPVVSQLKSLIDKYDKFYDVASNWEMYKKISVLESRKESLPKKHAQNIIDYFSIFRMQYEAPERDM